MRAVGAGMPLERCYFGSSTCAMAGSLTHCMYARSAALMSDVYEDHKDEDGFLYITYSGENTFGC